MDLENFLKEGKKIARGPIRDVSIRLGKDKSSLDRDDLEQEADLELLTLYNGGKVDFTQGWRGFVRMKVWGHLMNVAKKGWQYGESHVSESEFGTREADGSAKLDEIVFIYGSEGTEDEEKIQVRESLLATLRESIDSLSPEERFILKSYFVDGKSYEAIGSILGCSRETVRRTVLKVLENLKAFLQDKGWSEMDIRETL